MNIVHLMASPFVGGPERQVLGLARGLPADCRSVFLSFAESGRARPFLARARADGFEAVELRENFPRLGRAVREVADHLRRLRADVLCCNGYKPDLIGWRAARRAGIPVVAIAHGWTAVTWKVRFYEAIDRLVLRWFDRVACVSAAQADRVLRSGTHPSRVVIIRNAIDTRVFDEPGSEARQRVRDFFPSPPALVVGAAGRLSPEKGFDVLIDAAGLVVAERRDVGFLLCGDGPLREALMRRAAERGLEGRFVFAGFRTDVERLLPGWDLAALSSHTEGLPVAVLEALAAGVPVVATAVGGTPEVIEDGVNGYLVPPADPRALARRLLDGLADERRRRAMGADGWRRAREEFGISAQSAAYLRLFEALTLRRSAEPLVTGEKCLP